MFINIYVTIFFKPIRLKINEHFNGGKKTLDRENNWRGNVELSNNYVGGFLLPREKLTLYSNT